MNPDPQPLVVQHNALVNARFSFSTLETRLFLALLVRINRGDTTFSVCRIPVKELSPDSINNALYAEVDEMAKKLATRVLHIEVLGPNGERIKQPDRMNRPLMYQCDYIKSEGVVEARFSEGVREYLLDLRHNFTQAQLPQLLLIRSPASHRIYWLVKEYAQQGKTYRDIDVNELRKVLGLTTEYANRFDHFKARVLDRAQAELATTDVPITMEFFRQGKAVRTIRFHFASTTKTLALATPEEGSWQGLLIKTGIAEKSLLAIQAKLAAGDYPEGYIRYVVATVEAQVSTWLSK
jgi:plasmid replication initiation protein